jgi:hypothetical protein
MQRWQHCKLEGNHVSFLGAAGVFENKGDSHIGHRAAWSKLEDEGWELVSVVTDSEVEPVFYLKRPAPAEA